MTPVFVTVLMCALTVTTSVALWHTLTVVNRMSKKTHNGIRWSYVLRATGLFMLLLSVLDYLIGNPLTWPWLLLLGVAVATSGSALLHVVSQRACRCGECPVRDALVGARVCVGKAGRKA